MRFRGHLRLVDGACIQYIHLALAPDLRRANK
jgi:hypothetical protein